MDFTDRLLAVMEHYGHNKNSFSVAIGASSNSVIGRLVNERHRRPSFELIELIIKKFPAINPTWLILGEGEMFIDISHNEANPTLRIQKIMDKLGFSLLNFSESTGIPHSVLKKVMDGNIVPDRQMLEKIASAFPMINQDWISRNEGPMFTEGNYFSKLITYFEEIPVGLTIENLGHLVPSFIGYTSKFASRKEVIFGLRNSNQNYDGLIAPGDYIGVAVNPLEELSPGDLVFVSTNKRNYFRRLRTISTVELNLIDGQGTPLSIPNTTVTLCGTVICSLRIFD